MYMNVKLALPNNSNPGMVLPKITFNSPEDRLRYVAAFVHRVVEYNEILLRSVYWGTGLIRDVLSIDSTVNPTVKTEPRYSYRGP